ncbi:MULTISPECIES: SPOR domain-containing protein [unclassified Polynucleobacter]|uniref:SPOR domain-containing protein n=1 Tax=unclassified Polynucleobacter TaxID=2640945 RepID=UPI001F2B69CD|nr:MULTISPECIES: SPOR domain-containing protein [unclassified Polynucleobacter]MCE7526439.1 SPOR domain-containing protein [Polynucleobacter sp. IMCC 30228]MCE7529725.1 SPOR domain-containing protein [Polynucleobacter sp. IMCC 29146]
MKVKSTREFGGTLLGLILGLTLGLALALGVAFYLSKTPPQEKPGIRAPNLPLTIKPAVPVEEEGAPAATPLDLNKPLQGKKPPSNTEASPDPIRDIANGKKPEQKPADVKAPEAKNTEPIFFVQVGAYSKKAEADAQKANLAIQGIEAQMSEASVEGSVVWRVRIGPFVSTEDTKAITNKLSSLGMKPTIIRANKS